MKVKTTYQEFLEKSNLVKTVLITNAEEAKPGVKSKLKYAIQRFDKLTRMVYEEIQEKTTDINRKFAAEKPDTHHILFDEKGGYVYTKKAIEERDKELKSLNRETATFETYLFEDETRIQEFDEFIVEELRGFFFPTIAKI